MNSMHAAKPKPKRKPEKLMLRVVKGGLQPADNYTVERLRARGFKVGDLVASVLTKPRNPKFHRLVHAFGKVITENLEPFTGMDAHSVLKRLQVEGNIGCDEIGIVFPGVGPCTYRIPQSLSFESMDEGRFKEVFSQFCQYVIREYWPGMTEEQIEQMATLISNE